MTGEEASEKEWGYSAICFPWWSVMILNRKWISNVNTGDWSFL